MSRSTVRNYGKIPGVTDRDYYTNSFHVPVYYPISAFEKIAREAPYHELTNGGHISYIELDEQHAIIEVAVPEDWQGRSIGELDIRRK